METEQIDKRVTWLDEQRRKDSEHIARIHQRLDSLDDTLRKQNAQLENLATELGRISAVASRVRTFDDSLSQHRDEVNKQLETIDERRMSREKQLESIRKADQKQVSDSLEGMQVKLRGLDELRESMEVRRQEELRLNRAMDALTTQVKQLASGAEQRGREFASLQESRKQDGKNLAELESRSTELGRRIESQRGSLEAVEDQIGKLKSKSSELERSESELRHGQAVWTEQQAVRLAEFERQWKGWDKQFQSFSERAQQIDKKIESYQETFRELVRLRDELSAVVERLERRISEVGEIQRLNADRFKEEWAGSQADDQKRWTSFKLNSDELWKDHNRAHRKLDAELHAIQSDLEDTIAGLGELSRTNKQRLLEAIALVQDWGSEIDEQEQARD